jgi:hypothetical protein
MRSGDDLNQAGLPPSFEPPSNTPGEPVILDPFCQPPVPFPEIVLDPARVFKRSEDAVVKSYTYSDESYIYGETRFDDIGERIRFSVVKVDTGPELIPGVSRADVQYFDEEFTDNTGRTIPAEVADDQGRLTSDHIYMFATVKLQNDSVGAIDFYASNFSFITAKELKVVSEGVELRYNSADPKTGLKDGGIVKLGINETREVVLGFIVDPSFLDSGKLYFVWDVGGRNRCVKTDAPHIAQEV